jgi:hypothetical protein
LPNSTRSQRKSSVGSSFSKGRDGLVVAIGNGAKKWHGIYQKMILSSNREKKWHGIYQH